MKITLRNDFHNTTTSVRAEARLVSEDYMPEFFVVELSAAQLSRVRRSLCGMKDCKCGGIVGFQRLAGKRMNIRIEDPKLGVYYV